MQPADQIETAAAKALKNTVPPPGNQTIEPTLGMVFAVDATVPLEDIAAELERLNARTPSDHWPDPMVIATKGQIGYMVQWVGDQSVSSLLLPPSPGASRKTPPSYYAALMISASGAETFNLAMHMLLGQLARWSPGSVSPEYMTVLDGVPRQALIWTGYQYNLAGELRPVPRERYNDRALPLKMDCADPAGREGTVSSYVFHPLARRRCRSRAGQAASRGYAALPRWNHGRRGYPQHPESDPNDVQISSVLPIGERQYGMLLRNVEQREGWK